MKLNQITKNNQLKYFRSAGHIYILAGRIQFKKITCSRAADFSFAGRSLPTPALYYRARMTYSLKLLHTETSLI